MVHVLDQGEADAGGEEDHVEFLEEVDDLVDLGGAAGGRGVVRRELGHPPLSDVSRGCPVTGEESR